MDSYPISTKKQKYMYDSYSIGLFIFIYLLPLTDLFWQFTSTDSSHPLSVHIPYQFTSSDSSHPLIVHILWQSFYDSLHPLTVLLWQFTSSDSSHLTYDILWQFTSSNSSHYLTVHIIWQIIFHIFVPNPIIYDSLLYLFAYYPPPKYNNGKNNYVNIIFFSFCTSYISYQSATWRSIQMYHTMINTHFNHVYLYDVSWKAQAFSNDISKSTSWPLLNMFKYMR